MLMRAAIAGRLYNVEVKRTSNSGFDRTFMPCSGYFYALPNNERGTKYLGWSKTVREFVGLPIALGIVAPEAR